MLTYYNKFNEVHSFEVTIKIVRKMFASYQKDFNLLSVVPTSKRSSEMFSSQ